LSQAAAEAPPGERPPLAEDPRLTPARKSVYATGDFTVNTVLVSLSMVYVTFFLTQVAGLRPELAGLVQLIGRGVDAFTDPMMGRISDLSRWRWGRRRPFFLIGAIPFGLTFALLWTVPGGSQLQMFLYYTGLYVLLSLSMTVLAVPYLALLPEMATGYDARTSLHTYRNYGSVVGISAAIAFRPVAEALGGGPAGYALAGGLYGVAVAVPWLAVFRVSWERPDFQGRGTALSFREGVALLLRHDSFRRLTGLYLCSRITMDIASAMLILFFTFVVGRSGDFELSMGLFLASVVVSLPVWLAISRHTDKSTLFVVGSVWWFLSFGLIFAADPAWPRWLLIGLAPIGGVGFAVVDLMAWSMLGEVVDEDDLRSGERREGVYNGAFMFVRKLAGSIAVALALAILGWLGFDDGEQQSQTVATAIRLLTTVAPALFLAAAVAFAWNYPLTRRRHAEIVAALEAREAGR
jgi:sugar (glycoside-pentoside-hexuronide) transporter